MSDFQHEMWSLIQQTTGQNNRIVLDMFYVDVTGDWHSAALLGQLIYWTSRTSNPDGWVYKTAEDWHEELRLTRYFVSKATKNLEEKGMIETKLKKANGVPTVHYRVLKDGLLNCIFKTLKNENLKVLKDDSLNFKKSLTETTTETTTENTEKSLEQSSTPSKKEVKEILKELRAIKPLEEQTTMRIRMFREGTLDASDKTHIRDTDIFIYFAIRLRELYSVEIPLVKSQIFNGMVSRHVRMFTTYEPDRAKLLDFIDEILEKYKKSSLCTNEYPYPDERLFANANMIKQVLARKEKRINEKYVIAPVTAQRSAERTADTLKRAVADEEEETF